MGDIMEVSFYGIKLRTHYLYPSLFFLKLLNTNEINNISMDEFRENFQKLYKNNISFKIELYKKFIEGKKMEYLKI